MSVRLDCAQLICLTYTTDSEELYNQYRPCLTPLLWLYTSRSISAALQALAASLIATHPARCYSGIPSLTKCYAHLSGLIGEACGHSKGLALISGPVTISNEEDMALLRMTRFESCTAGQLYILH